MVNQIDGVIHTEAVFSPVHTEVVATDGTFVYIDESSTTDDNICNELIDGQNVRRTMEIVEKPLTRRSIYYQNVRWLRSKTEDLRLASSSFGYDVIALTETNLIPEILDGELFNTNNYSVYRCDRSERNSSCSSGGGASIAVKSAMVSEVVSVPGTESEVVVVKIQFRTMCTFVCCIYIPSNSPILVYQNCTAALQRIIEHIDLNVEDRFYVLGDFNMTNVQWSEVWPDDDSDFNDIESNTLLATHIDRGQC